MLFGPIWDSPFEEAYDCSNKTVEEWYQTGNKNVAVGVYFIVSGAIYMVLYLLCMYAMTSREFLRHSCYKLMLLLGFIDVSTILVNSILTGYLSLIGAVFCTHPKLIYFAGRYGIASWCAACAACVILALNRVCDISHNIPMKLLFQGKRLRIVMMIPIVYFVFFFLFTKPALFNSNYNAWFFDPFIGSNAKYLNIPYAVNNAMVAFCTTSLYGYLCMILTYKNKITKIAYGPVRTIAAQRLIFAQSLLICGFNAVAAWIYLIMQFVPVGNTVNLIGQIGWQTSHGFVCIVYLVMNRSIRNAVAKVVVPRELARILGLSMSSCGRQPITMILPMKPMKKY